MLPSITATNDSNHNNTESLDASTPPRREELWMADTASQHCLQCLRDFTLTRRRHHCRRCGRLVCGSCSRHRIPSAVDGRGQRACDGACFYIYVWFWGFGGLGYGWNGPILLIPTANPSVHQSNHPTNPPPPIRYLHPYQPTPPYTNQTTACYTAHVTKAGAAAIRRQRAAREAELRGMGSLVAGSEHLVRVFFLDGSYRTVGFDRYARA